MKSSSPSYSCSSWRKSSITFYLTTMLFVSYVAIRSVKDFTFVLGQSFPKPREVQNSEPQQQQLLLPPSSQQQQQQLLLPSSSSSSSSQQQQQETVSTKGDDDGLLPFAIGRTEEGCDAFSGEWVYDEASRPPYADHDCPFMEPKLKCQSNGRPDNAYEKWRWQPRGGCSVPSFNATFMLDRLRGKRMLFVGDSLTKGQFVSMLCLLRGSIPAHSSLHKFYGNHVIFAAPKYNATIEFYWAPFLVKSNCDNATFHSGLDRIIHEYSGSLESHARHWTGADVLVFNTYAWWQPGRMMKIVRRNRGKQYTKMTKAEDGYRLVLKSMVNWLEKNMDPKKTRVFFTTMSPTHFGSAEWGGAPDGNCYNETTPILDPTHWGSGSSKSMMEVVGEVFGGSRTPITIINITQLSEYRKDAHTSIYRMHPTEYPRQQLANPKSLADCNHWCLPGVQDTWNQLLYMKLLFP